MVKNDMKQMLKFKDINDIKEWINANVKDSNFKRLLLDELSFSVKEGNYIIEGNMLVSTNSNGFSDELIINPLTDDYNVDNSIKFRLGSTEGSYFAGEYKNNLDYTYSSRYGINSKIASYKRITDCYQLYDTDDVELVREDSVKTIRELPNDLVCNEVVTSIYRTDESILKKVVTSCLTDVVCEEKDLCDYKENREYFIAANDLRKKFFRVKYDSILEEEYNKKLGLVPSKVLFRENN